MFCSNCGKTIRPEDDACQHCGARLGEGRFYGNTYTSSQVRLPAEALHEAPEGGMISYTRTSYMSYDNQPQDDVYSNTTYRPLLSDEEDMARIEEEEAARQAAEEAEAAAEEETDETEEAAAEEQSSREEEASAPVEDESAREEADDAAVEEEEAEEEVVEDVPEISTSPLPPLRKAEISPRVLSYMEELENREQRRSGGGLRLPSFFRAGKKNPAADEETADMDELVDAEEKIQEEVENESADEPQSEPISESFSNEEGDVIDEDYVSEDVENYVAGEADDDFEYFEEGAEEDGESGKPKFALNIDFKALLGNRILKISAAAVLIVAVVTAGIVWLNFVTAKRAKIVDVTYSVYSQGIEQLKAHVAEDYRTEMKDVYLVNTSAANSTFSGDMQSLNALLPEEPQANDVLFVNALTIVQDAIADAIRADADAELNEIDRSERSTLEWQAIENAVTLLEEATSAGQLTGIISDLESVVAPTPSPSPSPTKTEYTTLQNGMMNSVQVQVMQNRLINLGFLSGEPDGDFGDNTEAAVKAFQRAAGLTADGVATSEVQELLFSDEAPRVSPSATETSAPASPDATSAG